MSGAKTLVIVGASYAGVQLAATARELGFEDPITILGDERHQPYQRPPLSKGLLTGKTTLDQLQLRGPDFFTQNRIDLQLGQRAAAVDAGARTVTLADGRTLDDALRVAEAAGRTKRACVIGGGFIGLEVASALRTRGVEVTVVEAQPHLLTRSFPPVMSAYVENAHRRRGIELLTGRGVRALHGTNGHVDAVELMDGPRVDCDLVVLGVGVLPNVELAQAAGIAFDNGILVDAFGRTSAPRVLSAGDVASMAIAPVPGGPARVRLESIQAANDGARAAASVVVGREQPNTAVPWFWSDQFDLKFQMAGLPVHGDEVVTRGDITTDKFSLFYLRDGVLVGAHSVNKPAEHMQSRKLIAARAQPTATQLADTSFDLKSVPTAAT
jgi:3-phenylpropionate/trans-cinnamate dioxygenase ferredoxin reductase subunit